MVFILVTNVNLILQNFTIKSTNLFHWYQIMKLIYHSFINLDVMHIKKKFNQQSDMRKWKRTLKQSFSMKQHNFWIPIYCFPSLKMQNALFLLVTISSAFFLFCCLFSDNSSNANGAERNSIIDIFDAVKNASKHCWIFKQNILFW